MAITINSLPENILLQIGSLLDDPFPVERASKFFKTRIATGCFEKFYRQIGGDAKLKGYLCESECKVDAVRKTYQKVMRELAKSGVDLDCIKGYPLPLLLSHAYVPFLMSYCVLFDALAEVEVLPHSLEKKVEYIRAWMQEHRNELEKVSELCLTRCGLVFVPPEISLCKNLRKLLLGFNRLSFLPAEVFELKQLEALAIPGNQIHELPCELDQLSNLKRLSACGNPFKTIPTSLIGLLSKLDSCAVFKD